MAIAPPTPELLDALVQACQQSGLDASGAELIHHYTNAVFLLPAEQAVARITTGGRRRSAAIAHRVTDWLATEHGLPTTQPLPTAPAVGVADSLITFWTYYPQPEIAVEPTSADLARLLRRLHDLPTQPMQLPDWQPLASLESTVSGYDNPAILATGDRDWLLTEVATTKAALAHLDWPLGMGLIHGDAWLGNLLWERCRDGWRPILGDWDGVAFGPREIDLIPTWHAATRYGRGPEWTAAFVDIYGHDLATWDGYGVLAHMRDLVQLTGPLRRARLGTVFEQVLRQRLTGIRDHDDRPWIALR